MARSISLGLLLLATGFLCGGQPSAQAQLGFGDLKPINTDALTDTGYDGQVAMATDGKGFWLAAWLPQYRQTRLGLCVSPGRADRGRQADLAPSGVPAVQFTRAGCPVRHWSQASN